MVLHERTRHELVELLGDDIERVAFVRDLPVDRWLHRLSTYFPPRVGENTFGFVMQNLTQWRQRALLKKLVSEQRVNVVHEPSPVSPKRPSLIFGVGAPVVIGPMNGGMSFPRPFGHLQKKSERWFVDVARRTTGLLNRLLPGKRRAAVLLVANQRTRQALPIEHPRCVIELVENGVDFSVFDGARSPRDAAAQLPLSFVFSGRLVGWKGLDLLLRVLADVSDLPFVLNILGDGPERVRLEALTAELGLVGRVVFHGFVPQKDCARHLASADLFLLPSVYECGGAVVLEAMAMGLPVITHAWGGPADYVNAASGILLNPDTSLPELEQAWKSAIRSLAEDPVARLAMGEAGAERVRTQFSWQGKIDAICAIYRHAIAQAATD